MDNSRAISLTVLGGGGEVGANCFQLCFNGHQIVIDAGTHPKKEGRAALPEFSLLHRAPDAVLLSHAHVDHCGALPYLTRRFPGTKIYTTQPTVRIMDRMLHNSVSVMQAMARERGIEGYPLYEHDDVGYMMRHVTGFPFDAPFQLDGDTPIEVRFRAAGHVLGSGSILLKLPGHTLYYTGDISDSRQELMGGFSPLEDEVSVDTLIIECTHGATEEARVRSYREESERLGKSIAGVLKGGGSVLIPSFALGRMQEVLNIVARLQDEGRIPFVPVLASGLGRAMYELYDRYDEYLHPEADLQPLDRFGRVNNCWDPALVRDMIARPCIIVATSGMMLENTPSALIAQEMVKQNHHGIFFVGYLDHETLGYKLMHAGVGAMLQFQLGREPVEVKLENIKRFHLSAHAPRAALRRVIEQIRPKNVIFVHGDPDAIAWMQQHAGDGLRAVAPCIGQTVPLEE